MNETELTEVILRQIDGNREEKFKYESQTYLCTIMWKIPLDEKADKIVLVFQRGDLFEFNGREMTGFEVIEELAEISCVRRKLYTPEPVTRTWYFT